MPLRTPQHRPFVDKPTLIGPMIIATTGSTFIQTVGALLDVIASAAANTGQTEIAVLARIDCTTGSTQVRIGAQLAATVSSTAGTITHVWGAELYNEINGGATISNLRGVTVQSFLSSGAGTITEYDGIRITDPIVSTGSIGTNYGILIDDITSAGANYAVKTGAGTVAFGDNVGINTTAFAAGSDVLGFGIASATPSTASLTTGAFQVYATSSGVHVLGPNGTRTTIAAP